MMDATYSATRLSLLVGVIGHIQELEKVSGVMRRDVRCGNFRVNPER
jgi:hypothetical protein